MCVCVCVCVYILSINWLLIVGLFFIFQFIKAIVIKVNGDLETNLIIIIFIPSWNHTHRLILVSVLQFMQ